MSQAVGPAPSARAGQARPSGRVRQVAAVAGALHQRRLLVVALFFVIFSFDAARPTDIDFWWHLKTGELIARTGAVPTSDPFSYTALGRPWVAHEWLWELGVYWLYQLGGYRLAVLASALVVTLTYALLYRLLRQLGANEIVSGALVAWAAVLALTSVGVRPRELTHLFLMFYVSRLLLYREGRVRHLWHLPPVMALWVNVHGPFVLGLGVLALFVAGAAWNWLFAGGKAPRHLLLVGLATLAATFVNPAGPRMLLYPVSYYLQADNPSFSSVTEFQSPNFHEPVDLVFAASILVLMVLGSRRRQSLTDVLLLVVFTLQTLVSIRHVAVYPLVVAPLLAVRLRDRFRLAGELPPPRPSPRLVALNWLLLCSLVALGIGYAARTNAAGLLQLGVEPTTRGLPVAGARFIEDEHLPDPVFNHQTWGGYLIYRWYPTRRVFIDGRIDVYGSAIVDEYREVASIRPGWRDVLDKYGVRTVLDEKGSALSTLLLADGGWDLVFRGEVEDVFVRRESRRGAAP